MGIIQFALVSVGSGFIGFSCEKGKVGLMLLGEAILIVGCYVK